MSRTFARLRLSAGAIAVATGLIVPSLAYAQASPAPYMSAMRYDAANRPTGTIAPDPDGAGPLKYAATRTTYDASGRMTKVETGELASWQSESIAPANWSGFTVLSSVETAYDVLDRKIQALGKDATGAIVSAQQISYDARGRLDCTATRMNLSAIPALGSNACTLGTAGSFGNDRITQNVYDVAGQLLVIKRAVGTPRAQDYVTYTYTLNGKQATVKDANGNLASMSYDGHDRQTRWTFPSKTTAGQVNIADYEEYVYDANGNRTSLRKRDGSVLTYQYDNLNRMTVKIVPERAGLAATHTRDVYYGYDNRGLQTYARFDSATGEGVASSYDGFGRLTSTSLVMDGASRTLSYQRDKNGNRTQVSYPDGNYFGFSFDGLNRMTAIGRNTANGMTYFAYNNRGAKSAVANGSWSYYGYDAAGRLTSINHDMAGTANDVVYGLDQYNPASQVTQRSTSNDAYAYTGDVNVNRAYAVNGLNQYTSAGAATFGYDANGNLTSDGANSFVYDVENRLVSRTGPATANLRYDPLGRLYETSGGAAGITRFLYDGDELVAEYNGAGTMLRRYVHGTGVDDPMAVFEGVGVADAAARLIKSNHQGSMIALTDWNGNLLSKNSYDDWGIPAAANASIAQGGRFAYTGQAWVPELGMYYYKARIYSPTLGRFLQTDPIGYEDDINLYAYVDNDPVNKIDPDGLSDLNLFHPTDDLYQAAEDFEPNNEMPNIYTVTGHGPPLGGISDRREGGPGPISVRGLLLRVKGKNFDNSSTILLASCFGANRGFASSLAKQSGKTVIATNGFVMYPSTAKGYKSDGRKVGLYVDLDGKLGGEKGRFTVFGSNGSIKGSYTSATYNPKTGQITFKNDPKIGSLISQKTTVCSDEKKCGK